MAITVAGADTYINANVIDSTDWTDADAAKKQRILNVADRELKAKYPTPYTIPDNATYEYAAVLATVFNDTNRLRLQGVQSYSVKDVSFAYSGLSAPGGDLTKFIPKATIDIINADTANKNLTKLAYVSRVKWTVM